MLDCNSRSWLSAAKALLGIVVLILCAPLGVLAQSDPLHIWAGKLDAASAKSWVDARLAKEHSYEEEILAVKGPRTAENTLRPYDNAINELALAGNEAYLMYALAGQKEVRDAAQALAQHAAEANTALSLNQEVYHALVALDMSSADPATRYYVQRTLLEYRLAGVDKDAAKAESLFLQSIALAQKQGALAWELRATLALSELLASRGRWKDALTLLTAICDRFTDGIETADLSKAHLLLSDLKSSS